MGRWIPNPLYDTCPQSLHDAYFVVGPDGKKYPTWHPPVAVDPATGADCTFGHEHGADPRSSPLWTDIQRHFCYDANRDGDCNADERAWSGLPFGYVNEVSELAAVATGRDEIRHEDHFGHKVELKSNERVGVPGGGTGPVCSVLAKFHQGSHSPDALTNNLHELNYFVGCDNGVAVRWSTFQIFGRGGEFKGQCAGTIRLGTPVPSTSPTNVGIAGREIPDQSCLEEVYAMQARGQDPSGPYYAMYSESWPSGVSHTLRQHNNGSFITLYGQDNWIELANLPGRNLMFFDAGSYFITHQPSRYFLASSANRIARTIDMCFETGFKTISHPDCTRVREQSARAGARVPWDSPLSPFKGASRTIHFDWITIENNGNGPVFYSNPFGTELRPAPDPSRGIVIPQYVSRTPSGQRVMYYFGKKEGHYDARGVRAPN